jgi:hypothetical protein
MNPSRISVECANLIKDESLLREMCNSIARKAHKDVGKTYEWMSSLWESHLNSDDLIPLIIRDDKDETIAVMPFYRHTEKMKGIQYTAVKPINSLYSTRGGFPIVGDEDCVVESIFDYFKINTGWDVFEICVQKNSSMAQALKEFARGNKYGIRYKSFDVAPFLKMDKSIEYFLSSKSGNFRSNLKRKEKKLKGAGELSLNVYTNPDEVERALSEVFEIEKKSWKVAEGSAIMSDSKRVKFYSLLAEKTANAQWLRVYVLKLDNRAIAFDFGLFFEKTYYMLKTSYDEQLNAYSPGVVLRNYVVKDLFDHGCLEHDFLWGSESYKLQWSSDIREYEKVFIYSHNARSRIILSFQRALDLAHSIKSKSILNRK